MKTGVDGRPAPNLFIIGAMKSGTTSLHHYLAGHPQVFMCEPKEPGYFVAELTHGNGLEWYLGHFRNAGSARVIGESSTHYAKLPIYQGVPERILDFNPDARFVYLMRDPVKRIVSHYWHNVRNHFLEAERRDFSTAVTESPGYLAYGDYAMQLQPWFRIFGRERVFCMVYEEMVANPVQQTDALRQWLGLDGPVPEHVFSERWNVRPSVMRKVRGFGLLNRFAHSRLWSSVAPMVPKGLRRYASGSLASRVVDPEVEISEAMLAPLRPQMEAHVEALRHLLGRDFPQWLRPTGV